MYLISLYFDDQTNQKINALKTICQDTTGNLAMKDVPPHITIASFDGNYINDIIDDLDKLFKHKQTMPLEFVSLGMFHTTLFLQPVYHYQLHDLKEEIDDILLSRHMKISSHYQLYRWLVHVTLDKDVKGDKIGSVYQNVYHHFDCFQGKITAISISSSHPYLEYQRWQFK